MRCGGLGCLWVEGCGYIPTQAGAATLTLQPCVRRYGFATFEKKDDAQRALSMCRQNQFLIGSSPMPALVEMARIEVCKGWALALFLAGSGCKGEMCLHGPRPALVKLARIGACKVRALVSSKAVLGVESQCRGHLTVDLLLCT